MRNLFAIAFLFVLTAFGSELRAQMADISDREGVVTFADARRKLLVIQNGDLAQALKLDVKMPLLQPGERVRVEGQIAPYFRAFPDYPSHPSDAAVRPAFETPTDSNDHFLARLRGFLRVPADGDYTFWVMADAEGELLLGSNDDPATARVIAKAPKGPWPLAWDRTPEQKSQPVSLKAGGRYYIEARQREWRGHDLLAVAWQGATFEREVIGGRFLSPWGAAGGATNGILYETWTNCFITRLAALSPESQTESMVEVNGARVEPLGQGQMPVAQRVVLGGARSDVRNFAWAEVEGTTSFSAVDAGVLTLEVKPSNARNGEAGAGMQFRVLNWGERPVAHLLGRKVRARGVCERMMDSQGQPAGGILWIQDEQQLELMSFAESDSRDLEMLPMFEITPANLNLAWGRKVLVRGTVLTYDREAGRVLLRADDSFYAYCSSDGKSWTPFGTPVQVAMDDSILVGLAAASITATQAELATFSQIGVDLSRSQTVGIGGDPTKGSVTISNGTASFWPAASRDTEVSDGGMFVCQPLPEEGEIFARIDAFNAIRNSDKAGLMMRESLEGDAPFAALVMTHGNRLDFLYRRSPGSLVKAVQRAASPVPRWLKLVRRRHMLVAQLMHGETLRLNEQVELVGRLNWTNGEPMLANAYVRPAETAVQPAPSDGTPQEVQIADLPTTAEKVDQYQNQDYLLRGVVTFKGRAFDKEFMFLQDESGAASLRVAPPVFRLERIEPGRLLEVEGGVLFSPGVPPFRVSMATVLGDGVLPRPMPYPGRSDAKLADSRWVEAEGIVRSVTNNVMRLMERNGPLLVWVGDLGSSQTLARYVDCLVIVRGVFSLQAASEPALLVPSPGFIEVKESAPKDPFVIPSFAINKVGAPDLNANLLHRIKVTGVITYRDERMVVVQDQTGGARVLGGGLGDVRVGDQVEVVGFSDLEGEFVTMREPVVRKLGEAHSPEPVEMMMEGLLDARLNGWLVRLEGIVLDQKTRQGWQLLELQNGQRVFEAVLAEDAGQLKPLAVGSRVRVTGVTDLQIASQTPNTTPRRDYPLVATMDVLMRTPVDLVLLERPPWWTWRHTAAVGAVLVVILLAAVGWIRSLRRRVAQRTGELQVAMGRLQKETELSATLAERERLAAEIHDTLEQGMSGIMMQLDGLDSRLPGEAAEARQNLEMARRMVRFSRAEVRHSLWNLESQLLKDGDLGAAIKEIVRQMSAGSATKITVDVSDTKFALPPAVEHHLLRCTQEAISNALKHAGAKNIRVNLNYQTNSVELAVVDDGHGFDSGQILTGPGTHLGLRNLRSRARKMKGQLEIASQPENGTTVRLTVPVNDRSERKPASNQ